MKAPLPVLVGCALFLVLVGCAPATPPRRSWSAAMSPTNAVAHTNRLSPSRSGPLASGAAPMAGTAASATNPVLPRYPIVKVVDRSTGRVATVSTQALFVVVDFGFNPLPRPEQRLTVFRTNQPVGTLRMTGAPNGSFMAADIMSGEARPGDEVRDDR